MSDVAKLAGVSTMTVSRVLNENVNVTDDTRKRVLAAVEKLQYRRNEIARSLREQTSRQIGILVPNLYDPFFATCAHAISLVAKGPITRWCFRPAMKIRARSTTKQAA